MTKRVHGNNLLLVGPLREWSDVGSGFSIGKIRSENRGQLHPKESTLKLSFHASRLESSSKLGKIKEHTCGLL